MKTLSKYMLLGVVATGLWSCSSEEAVKELTGSGRTVQITVNVSREGDAATRTQMSDEGANLGCVWTEGDKLLVTDKNGNKKGVLSLLSSSVSSDEGTFTGDLSNVTNGEHDFNLIYLGKAWSASGALAANAGLTTNGGKTTFTADYSTQDGSIESLTDKDILAKETKVNVKSGSDYALVEETVTLQRKISFAKFSLSSIKEYKSDLNYDELGYLVVSGEGLMKSATINVGSLNVEAAGGDVLVEKKIKDNDNDFYMVLLPGETEPKPIQVSVSNGDDVYTGTYSRTTGNVIAEGKYYRKDLGNNQYAGLPLDNWSTKKNPGGTGNWGTNINLMPDYQKQGNSVKFEQTAGGWTTNTSLWYNGGFGTYIKYKQNGIAAAGFLFSDDIGEAYYFQWGRWVGFPPTVYNWHVNSQGSWRRSRGVPSSIPGVSAYNDGKITSYIWDNNEWGFPYQSCYFSNLSKTEADRFALVYACVSNLSNTMDYMEGNSDYSWEDRCGNPCRDGYRLPIPAELKAFIPEQTKEIKSKHAEIKTVKGVKYATKWVVNTTTSPYRLEISSVKTDKTSVSIEDAIFNNAPVVYLWAMGYLDYDGVLKS